MIFIYFIFFVLGMYILIKSSNYLVEGASSVAAKLNLSPLVIGLTIVAFGTSAPELVVSISSALSNSSEIAIGNVVGSNIFNILIILGITALIYPIQIKRGTVWKEIPFSLLGVVITFLLAGRAILNGTENWNLNSSSNFSTIGLAEGLILLSIFVVFMYYIYAITKAKTDIVEFKVISNFRSVLYIILGIFGLSLSAKFLVTDSAVQIARFFNVSEVFIGLTLVSVGTSLPELATSIAAALKKNAEIVVGNIVGSNIYNITLILGTTLIIRPISINGQNMADLIMLMFSTLVLFLLVFAFQKNKLQFIEGLILIAIYSSYLGYLFIR